MKFFIVQFKGFNKILTEEELRLVWNSCGFPKIKKYNEVKLSEVADDLYHYEGFEVNIIETSPIYKK